MIVSKEYKPSRSLALRRQIYLIIACLAIMTFPLATILNNKIISEKTAIVIGLLFLFITILIVVKKYNRSRMYHIYCSDEGIKITYTKGVFFKIINESFSWDSIERISCINYPRPGIVFALLFGFTSYKIIFKLKSGDEYSIESSGDPALAVIAIELQKIAEEVQKEF